MTTRTYQGKLTIMQDPHRRKEFVRRESPPPAIHRLDKFRHFRWSPFEELDALKVRIRRLANISSKPPIKRQHLITLLHQGQLKLKHGGTPHSPSWAPGADASLILFNLRV